jgi:CRISPR-associated protein Cmr3
MTIVRMRGVDSLLLRDGRPFSNDIGAQSARTLPLPHPSTLAGYLRTRIGTESGWQWDAAHAQMARQIEVHGPLPVRGEGAEQTVVFPAPRDAVVFERPDGTIEAERLTPENAAAEVTTDLPFGLVPLILDREEKPASGCAFWEKDALMPWLAGDTPPSLARIGGLPRETRTHVKMADFHRTTEEGALFQVEYLCPREKRGGKYPLEPFDLLEWSFLARASTEASVLPNIETGSGYLGGERRHATLHRLSETQAAVWPTCPASLADALKVTKKVRLLLATPALFGNGWYPGWLDEENGKLVGTPPNAGNLRLCLKAAAIGRREPVSGWDLERGANGKPKGAKPARWMVPAGSVYFFEKISGDTVPLTDDIWLAPVSDAPQDKRDGFGLACWGVY